METNTTLKVVYRTANTEELRNEPVLEVVHNNFEATEFHDSYDYFPDFGI
jgi:hypothetical protein